MLSTFFEDDDTIYAQKQVDDQKLSQYAHGTTKKSRREKEREAQEAKTREEEDLTAKAYDEFLETFESEGSRIKGAQAFVKASGGTETATSYLPKIRGRGAANSHAMEEERPVSPPGPRAKGKRAMDSFLEEIKREQAEREQRLNRPSRAQGRSVTALAAYETQSGSKDRGDPATSNLFVANLPSSVSEPALGNFCARFGPVASVKIMWPRTDASMGPGADMTHARRIKNSGLSGFVSFMKRKDAEIAIRELDGFEWGGNILRVGWSKAVPIGPKALYSQRGRSPSPDLRHRSASRSRSRSTGRHYRQSRSNSRERRRSERSHSPPLDRKRKVDPNTENFIRIVAALVREYGKKFEDNLKEKEGSNPKYSFLCGEHSSEQQLYHSLVNSSKFLELPFWDDGYNSVYSTDSAEESERERGPRDRLGRLARRRFESMLRALTGRRGEIARCMAFSLEHAESASEVADIITSSILIDSTPVPRKVARLHLICDILHNSAASVPNAWKFRQEFQARLGLVFDHLSTIYHSFPGRITAETFKTQITAVIEVWEDSIVFPPDFTTDMRLRLEGGEVESPDQDISSTVVKQADAPPPTLSSKFKASSFKPASSTQTADNESVDMDVEEESDDKNKIDDDVDVDGVPLDDDIDGQPLDDVDGEPLDELDGRPL